MTALTPNDPVFQPGFERADTSVVPAICLYGYYGSLDADERFPSSALVYVRADAPPFFLGPWRQGHPGAGGGRPTLRPAAAADLVQPSGLRGAARGQHTFDLFDSLRFEAVVDGIEAFAA